MQRPVMDPTFMYDAPASSSRSKVRFAWIWRILRLCGKVLLYSPFGHKASFRNEEGTRLSRFVRGMLYRIAFVPVILITFLAALVFAATHPGRIETTDNPLSLGIYYDPVNFLSDDGARLEGWLVPVVDARKVLEEKESIVGKRYPAVVLVHDFAGSRQQLLPLIQPLHQAEFVVLAVNLRGSGTFARDAQTFGIKEAMDVKAAVEMLRRRSFVDPAKVAVVGVGTGANAAVLAARNDPGIAALVLAEPIDGFDDAFAQRVGDDANWLPPFKSLVRWTFQVMYGVDTSDLEMSRFATLLQERHVLMTDGQQSLMQPNSIRNVREFLIRNTTSPVASAN